MTKPVAGTTASSGPLSLTPKELEFLLSPTAVRERCFEVYRRCERGAGYFQIHIDKVDKVTDFVVEVIKDNYPDLKIPFHSRWSHFQAGKVDRLAPVRAEWSKMKPNDRLKSQLDLAIVSVLLDAGSGPTWKYEDPIGGKPVARSEGLAVASLAMFCEGSFSGDKSKPYQVDAKGLQSLTLQRLAEGFQVTDSNPLAGIDGRLALLLRLGVELEKVADGRRGRPSDLFEALGLYKDEGSVAAPDVLGVVLRALGPIWPARLEANGVSLGDTWNYAPLGQGFDSLVPFHKLSQWLTYSLLEPILERGHEVTRINDMTGLPEYRNGGLILDSGLVSLKDAGKAEQIWTVDSDLIIEWRALTVTLLDILAQQVRKSLKRTSEEFPLVRVLEGGTWWAGRRIAAQLRPPVGGPPLQIQSDGTVF
jgi:hypothetical protein